MYQQLRASMLPGPTEAFKIVTEAMLPVVESQLREIGDDAVWSVSSAKHGNGVAQLRDGDRTSYWQSDGHQPHQINISLPRLHNVVYVAVLVNFQADESYTPKKITLRTGIHNWVESGGADVDSPSGWIFMRVVGDEPPAAPAPSSSTVAAPVAAEPMGVHSFFVQVHIVENHQNGRDTHVRGVRIYTKAPPEVCTSVTYRSAALLR